LGEAHPKASIVFDGFSLFARVGHWANIFELTTKYHGGWIVGNDWEYKDEPFKTQLFSDVDSIKIPDYDFAAEVKFVSKASCPDHCLKNPCL
jgi:hypothetical protein